MTELFIIALAGFFTGITTLLFGFGGGFVVVPFVYHFIALDPALSAVAMHIAVATSGAVMVFNAGYASYLNQRRGHILKKTVIPLIYFIAFGAVIGAWLSLSLADGLIRLLFIGYMVLTLADCLLRPGFMQHPARRGLSRRLIGFGGMLIGMVAALLGVGGSVMTVPLLRRHGYQMKYCVSAANPLSLPVAVCSSLVYAQATEPAHYGWHYLGLINLTILSVLIVAGALGMVFAKGVIPPIADRWHARIYLILLFLVLIAIAW